MANSISVNALVMGTQRKRPAHETYTNQECINQDSTAYYNNKCWIKYPKLLAEYDLKYMRFWGLNQNLKKTAEELESWEASAKQTALVACTSEINSW